MDVPSLDFSWSCLYQKRRRRVISSDVTLIMQARRSPPGPMRFGVTAHMPEAGDTLHMVDGSTVTLTRAGSGLLRSRRPPALPHSKAKP